MSGNGEERKVIVTLRLILFYFVLIVCLAIISVAVWMFITGCAIHTSLPRHTQLSSPPSAESATLPPDCNIVVYTDDGAKAIGWICAPAVPPHR